MHAIAFRLLPAFFVLASPLTGHGTSPLGVLINKSGTNVTGVTFRVWAPNATGVAVRGQFNGWTETDMVEDAATGFWTATVANARPGDDYKYRLRWAGNSTGTDQLDPRSLWVRPDKDGNLNSVIYDHSTFDWGTNKAAPYIPAEDRVMYEMHIGTFFDPDPHDSRPGTFSNAISRLPYLRRLGINVIALMPVSEFFTATSWGYNPQYPFAIEDSYGGPDEFKRFVREAHRLGMNVQLDVVHNHYSSASEPAELLFFGGTNSYFYNTNLPVGRTRWGPRPNYADTNVRSFITDNIRMFLEHYAIEGFRWDSPRNFLGFDANSSAFDDVRDPQTVIPEGKSLLAEINELMHTNPAYAGRWSVSEDSDMLVPANLQTYTDPFLAGLQVTDASQSFDGHWQTSFHNDVTPQIASATTSPGAINAKINEWSEPPGWRVIFTDNHDKAGHLNKGMLPGENPLIGWRLANRMDPANQSPADPTNIPVTNSMTNPVVQKKVLLNAVLTLTAPGVPMLFMGQEFGATDSFNDGVRMDWRAASRHSPTFRAHRDLVSLRRNLPALRFLELGQNGNSQVNGSVLAYWRTNGVSTNNHVFVALNFSSNSTSLPLTNLPSGGNWYARVNTDWTVYGGSTAPSTNALTTNSELFLPAYSSVVLAKSPPPPSQLTNTSPLIPDGWMDLFGLVDTSADDDEDGLSNVREYQNGLDPLEKDVAMVALDGRTNTLRTSVGNSFAQHVFRATSAVTSARSPLFTFLSNTVVGPTFTNPSSVYIRLGVNLANTSETVAYFFTPNTNLAVVDTNRTNWAVFHGVTSFGADSDGDTFSDLQEFARGSDPNAPDRTNISLAGQFNGWNESANPMSYAGAGRWIGHVPGRQGTSGEFKFTAGTWATDWGDNIPPDFIADLGGSNIVVPFANGNGMYRFVFDEKTLAYQVAFDPTDANGDGIHDAWTNFYGLTGPNALATADPDGDGLANLLEFLNLANPLVVDSATVIYNDRTNVMRAVPNNPLVQHIAWAVDAAPVARPSDYSFLSNNIPGSFFTNPARTYLRFSLNLSNSNSTWSFFTPNTNLAVVDTNRTNWAVFHGVTSFGADSDGDTFSDLQEFARGSDPNASDRTNISLAGQFNGWNESANPMSYAGAGRWIGHVPGRQGTSGEFQFTDGSWNTNWGDNLPADFVADLKGRNIVCQFSNGNGMYRFVFDEKTLVYQVAFDPTDANGDGIHDAWTNFYGLTGPNALATADPDGDGWSNLAEFRRFANTNNSFMNPVVSDATNAPKRMTVSGSTNGGALVPFWSPNLSNMTWSDLRNQWEWTGTAESSGSVAFKFFQGPDWPDPDWGLNTNGPAGRATLKGPDISASVSAGIRYRITFNDLALSYSVNSYPIFAEWWETNGLPLPLPTNSADPRWNDDSDGDGFSHRLEYALGGIPLVPNGSGLFNSWQTNTGGSNRLVLQWLHRTNGGSSLEIVPVVSTSLTNTPASWSTTGVSISTNVSQIDVPSGFQRREASVPLEGAARFLRLRVTGP